MARFEVDLAGMRELQEGRELWRLTKELPVNVFDEFVRDDVERRPTYCAVNLSPVEGRRQVWIVVEDDGQGFQSLEDAYTLFRTTPKRGQANVAGRFNLGEKELMAAAVSGSIATTSGTVTFMEQDRQVDKKRRLDQGTMVSAVLKAKVKEIFQAEQMLRRLIPPEGLVYTVNGERVRRPNPVAETTAPLATVIQQAPGEPMRPSTRTTEVKFYEPMTEGLAPPVAWLYELGCPIQPIEAPFSVDIGQKVPLPPERDTVSAWYLKDIFAVMVNVGLVGEDTAGQTYTKLALEDSTITEEAVKEVVRLRHGGKVALWSTNRLANEKAQDAGYNVVHPRTLSSAEREAYEEKAGVDHTSRLFGGPAGAGPDAIPVLAVQPTDDMLRVGDYAKFLAQELLHITITATFYSQKGSGVAAEYGGNGIAFNVGSLGESWFRNLRPTLTGLILHELAHHSDNGARLPHGPEYYLRLDDLAGKAFHMLLAPEGFEKTRSLLRAGDQIG